MHPTTTAHTAAAPQPPLVVHPAWLRATHWLNVVAVVVMVGSGWRIFNAAPLWPLRFPPEWTLGGWLGGALQWHFAGMWLLAGNGLIYLAANLASGRALRKFWPLRPSEVWRDAIAALRGRLDHDDLQHYNALQKLAYLGVVLDLVLLVLSGLVLWKSVQFPLLRELLGGYEAARWVHFVAMALLLVFVAVHVVMVAIVPRTLLAMLRGR
jgi:thiosulfate reductase cytochrome b subunit